MKHLLYKLFTDSDWNRLLVSISWLTGTQLITRLLRLLSIIVVARILLPEDYGIAAIVLTTNELFHSLSHGCIASKLVQAKTGSLKQLRSTVYCMSWGLALLLAASQSLLSWPLADFYQRPELVLPLSLLALSYLMLPLATVQSAMLLREGNHHILAKAEIYQAMTEVILTLLLAINGFGFWALVLPKLLVVPVWVIYIRKHYSWKDNSRISFTGWQSILRFGLPLAGTDLLQALRLYLCSMLIAASLGIEALGVFYFASNAGLGISMSLVRALNQVLFPHLCKHARNSIIHNSQSEFNIVILFSSGVIVPVILLQCLLAPFYVPLLFGEQWQQAGAIPILILMCLSAIPLALSTAASQSLRAFGETIIEFYAQLIFTLLYATAIITGLQWGLEGVALSVVIVHFIFCPGFALFTSIRIKDRLRHATSSAIDTTSPILS